MNPTYCLESKIVDEIFRRRGVNKEDFIVFREGEYTLKNMKEAEELFLKHISKSSKLGILVDVDCDGICSAKVLIELFKKLNYKNFDICMNKNKKHGINEGTVDWCKKEGVKLLLVPDSSTNEIEVKNELVKNGIDVIVLDHHIIQREEALEITDNCVTVNCNYIGSGNRNLSGAGVTYKFVKGVCDRLNINNFERIKMWVGLSVLSDSCSMIVPENRYFVKYLYDNYKKDLFLSNFFDYGSKNNMFVFNLIPLINSCIRMGEESVLYNSILFNVNIKSNIEKARQIINKQKELTEEALGNSNYVEGENLVITKIDIKYRNICGLVANKMMNKFDKGSLVLYTDEDDNYSGSFRGGKYIEDLDLNNIGITTMGHRKASGVRINRDKYRDTIRDALHIKVKKEKEREYDLNIIFEEYNSIRRDLYLIAQLNEFTGEGFDKIKIKISGLDDSPEVFVYDKVTRLKYKQFDITDFSSDKTLTDILDTRQVLCYPCLNRDLFTLVVSQ